MTQKQLSIPTQEPTIQIINNQLMVSSLDVAEKFNKRHDNVVRAIKSLDIPKDFNALNFEDVEYADIKGEKRKAYNITRDGFVILVMGFTGKEAMQWKIRYIQAFNAMEAELSSKPLQLDAPSTKEDRKPITDLLNTWVKFAPIDYRSARIMLNVHLGVVSADQIMVSQIVPATEWLQEQINLHTVKTEPTAHKLSPEYETAEKELYGLYEQLGSSYFTDLDIQNPDSPLRLISNIKRCIDDTLQIAVNYDKVMVQLQKFEADYLRISLFRKMLGEGK